MRKTFARRAWAVLLGTAALMSLQACDLTTTAKPPQARLDMAAEVMPFPRPAVEPLTTLADTPELPGVVNTALDLRRAFFARDFARLDTALLKMHEDFLAGRINDTLPHLFISGIESTQLAGVDACEEWLQAMPQSFPARWVCGVMWESGAWAARSKEYTNKISTARFAIMHERLQRSNELLEKALALHPKPLNALTTLASNHLLVGDRQRAEEYLRRAEEIMPQYLGIHTIRLNYDLPEWGGSSEQVQADLEHAKALGVKGDDLTYLEDTFIVRPTKLSDPRAPQAYWRKAISEHPTQARLSGLLDNLVWVENWGEALPVADRLIEDYPHVALAYYRRAVILNNMGRIPEAVRDYRMAAAMGQDDALQELLMANIRGGLGLQPKSFAAALDLCRYGAPLGSRVGANCIGASYQEAKSMGLAFPVDHGQSLAWHLVAARGGHFNSQHDLGWFLFTGRGDALQGEEAKRLGTFWLRRAAEQDHHFAKRKLEENNISLAEGLEDAMGGNSLRAYLEALLWILNK